MSLTFDCAVCVDQFDSTPVAVIGDTICGDCCTTGLVPQFHAAFKDETKYPVKWSGHTLDINDFHGFFSRPFLRDWAAKKVEYQTPIARRLYCADGTCGRYLGLRPHHDAKKYCMECGGVTCANCSAGVQNNQHECTPDNQSNPFESLQRGRDYQRCPNCGIVVSLREGCNHMVCSGSGACSTNFCFICGEEAWGNSDHWSLGKPCPRYNQPGDRAVFDRAPAIGNTDNDARILRILQLGRVIAGTERAPPAGAAQELRTRYADRRTLHRIASEALRLIQPQAGRTNVPTEFPSLVVVSLLASGLITSLAVYTLHLEADEDVRSMDSAIVEFMHPLIQEWESQAGELGRRRYPELGPIYERYLSARRARLGQ